MAKLEFTSPPEGLQGQPYRYYRDWLEVNFFNDLCSYCLLQFPNSLQIEHYEPRYYAPDREDDPANLLLGCPWCNSGKKDYHPKHLTRRRLPKENDGHRVIDIREEDFSDLFELQENGELLPKNGEQKERAVFNITKLLRLDIPKYVDYRKKCLEYASACEALITDKKNSKSEKALNILIAECAGRYSFFKAFNIHLSPELEELIRVYLGNHKPKIIY